jgi:signal transduction histidine kinase
VCQAYPATVARESARLAQAFTNLIDNATRHGTGPTTAAG